MTTPEQLLEKLNEDLMAIPHKSLRHSRMPTEWLNLWISRIISALNSGDAAKFREKGVDESLINSLSHRHTVYMFCSAQKINAEEAKNYMENTLTTAEAELFDYLSVVERTMKYAYRKDKHEMGNIKRICSGSGVRDAVDDLIEYHEIISRKPEALEAINADPNLKNSLIMKHGNISRLMAKADNAPTPTNEKMILQHRAYTYLMLAVDEITACAEYTYGRKSKEFEPYVAEYYINLGKKSSASRSELKN